MSIEQKGSSDMKIVSVIVLVFGLVVLCFSWHFMSGMVDVLKRGNEIRDVSSGTNAVCRSAAMLNVSGVGNKVDEGSLSMIAAYESLSNELSSWLAIMGIFVTIFGLVIPIGSYLLQQRSLNREKEDLKDEIRDMNEFVRDDVKDKIKDMKEEMKELGEQSRKEHQTLVNGTKTEILDDVSNRMKPMWNFLASNFDRFLVYDEEKIERAFKNGTVVATWKMASSENDVTLRNMANFFISFDIYLDCLVRADNARGVLEAIRKYQRVLDAARDNHDLWSNMLDGLKIERSPYFVKGRDFAKLIGADNADYAWLKSLYDEVIPWKFS